MEWLPKACPGLTVDIQSVAGVATTVCVTRHKELNIMFDVGQHVNLAKGAVSHVFVSHGHLDHIGAMFSLARMHGFGPKHPIFVVPEVCMEPVLKAKAAFEALDGSPLNLPLVAVTAGMEIDIGRSYRVEAIRTTHRVPSVGYALHHLVSRTKPEYERLSGPERGMLARQGIQLTERQWHCELVYTGDTRIEGVLTNPVCFQAEILITEATFLGGKGGRDTVENAREKGHIHLDELVANSEAFESAPVQRIVLCHFSQRYSRRDIIETVTAKLSPGMRAKVGLALRSFGGGDVYLGDSLARSAKRRQKATTGVGQTVTPQSGAGLGRIVCTFLARQGRCSYGAKCVRSHNPVLLRGFLAQDLTEDGTPRSAAGAALLLSRQTARQTRNAKKSKPNDIDVSMQAVDGAASPTTPGSRGNKPHVPRTNTVCKFWRKSGGCRFGSGCRNIHGDRAARSVGGGGGGGSQGQVANMEGVDEQYWD